MEVEDSSGDQCKELKGIYKLLVGYVGDLHTYIYTPINTNTQISRLFHFEKWTGMCLGYVCPFLKIE